ncbi:Cilia- and flagella-associated protein 45 [Fasciola hepatica]|uniref:Cilia- and flagella-associated protein 45 n=1 Tax=Fasciola hepatica TaxID=6192 RepID=A0A4E0R656_FASHE|nr:Cilia- and flagella-associated protein 45 [Fasciola hepatica]
MPSSSVLSGHSHSGSVASGKSSASRRSKGLYYRTIDKRSVVDENLFGEPQRIKDRQVNTNNEDVLKEPEITVYRPNHAPNSCEDNRLLRRTKKIKHISSDLVRELMYVFQVTDIPPEYLQEASNMRKQEMRKYDLARTKNAKLTDLEEEARKQAEVLLQKALEQRQDQEDEIKALNELILNAKIQAIRDEQILEKQQIKKEMVEEDLRLDDMMEKARQNAIRIQEEIDKKRQEQASEGIPHQRFIGIGRSLFEMLGACEVLTQIQQNKQDRLLELEREEQENLLTQQRIAEERMKDIANRELKYAEQAKMRAELNEANDEMRRKREEDKERDRLFDLQIVQIQKEKAEREAAYEAEQARVRMEKEMEVARLRAVQERASDEAAERDALRAKRAAEAREREWRRKEAVEAQKKSETEKELRTARTAQAEDRRRLLAVEAGRERMEFERILKRQQEMIENDQREANELRRKNEKYASEIRHQICEREQERIAERNAFFEEGVKLEEEARIRQLRLADAKNRKLRELREAGIPEKYLAQVERKVLHLGEAKT